jgi:hypothetical protein
MRSLGSFLQGLGSLGSADFENHLKSVWLAGISYKISYLEQSLSMYSGKPVFWAEEMKRYIAAHEDFAINGRVGLAHDLLAGRSEDEALTLGRRLTSKFGELLQWWPVIWETARKLNGEGRGAALPLV